MRETHAGPPGAGRGGIWNGSPRDRPCANTGSGENDMGPVPLYLVPVAIAGEIRRLGGVISEVHVRRTGRHCYAIAVVTRGEAA